MTNDAREAACREYDRREIWDSGSHRGDARRAFEAGWLEASIAIDALAEEADRG